MFNPLIHLAVSKPTCHFYTFPEEKEVPEGSSFKFTEPFQVLSQEGIRVVKEIVERNKDFIKPGRQHANIRGMGFRSRFIKDLNQCTLLSDYFSDLLNMPL